MAFVRTLHTVDESVGSVEVCVNLTHPNVDILDEFILLRVIDHPDSIYIPNNTVPASKKIHLPRNNTTTFKVYIATKNTQCNFSHTKHY